MFLNRQIKSRFSKEVLWQVFPMHCGDDWPFSSICVSDGTACLSPPLLSYGRRSLGVSAEVASSDSAATIALAMCGEIGATPKTY